MNFSSGTLSSAQNGISLIPTPTSGTTFSVRTTVTRFINDTLPNENPNNRMASMTQLEGALKKRPANLNEIRQVVDPEIFGLLVTKFSDMLMVPPENPDQMIWYRQLADSQGRHHHEIGRMDKFDIHSGTEDLGKMQEDFRDFYENGKPCTARIALRSGPLFVYLPPTDRRRFQDLFGCIPEGKLDISKPNDMFLYSMSEAA